MSYIVPSVLVYQELASNGGVANITPDLDACIIGPCYNLVSYVAGSSQALTKTRATLEDGSPAVYDGQAVNAYLPSQIPGQDLDDASLAVYLNSARVQSKYLAAKGPAGDNKITVSYAATMTASTTSGSKNVVLSGPFADLFVNDTLIIAGAGVGGSDLTARITAISGANATLDVNARVTLSAAVVTRNGFYNRNLDTSTKRMEPGDRILLTLATGGATISTTVLSVEESNNNVAVFYLTDNLPTGGDPFPKYYITVLKTYQNLQLPEVYATNVNYTSGQAAAEGYIGLAPVLQVGYGQVVAAEVHIEYRALRTDLAATVLDIADESDRLGRLGEATEQSPLALGVQLALANTTGRIRAIAVPSDDLSGYITALNLAESVRLYAIVPLTQKIEILAAVQQHVEQQSSPEFANWRMALVNTFIPSSQQVGIYNENLVNDNGGLNTLTAASGSKYNLSSSNSTFISDGVVPGDIVMLTRGTPGGNINPPLAATVAEVISNQLLKVVGPTEDLTAVSFYVKRNLSRSQQADVVAAASTVFGSNRVTHVQPDLCGVSVGGVTKYLPGFYLCCALAGLISGLPAQKGLTNIGVAGISDLQHSNFYFTRAQLNTIAAAGTLLMVQESQGGLPYVRHSLTTDMTVLQYREVQQVKNIDYLSYYFHDILKGFPGRYNITPDSLQILRTTVNAAGKLLIGKRLPKIGAPLIDFTIKTLKQDPDNRDHVIIELPVTIPTVMNYINLYLIV